MQTLPVVIWWAAPLDMISFAATNAKRNNIQKYSWGRGFASPGWRLVRPRGWRLRTMLPFTLREPAVVVSIHRTMNERSELIPEPTTRAWVAKETRAGIKTFALDAPKAQTENSRRSGA